MRPASDIDLRSVAPLGTEGCQDAFFHQRVKKDTSKLTSGWLSKMTKSGSHQLTILSDNDLQGIYDFIQDAEIIEGPDELYAIVAELWPELLHKVKPPRALMH